MATVLLLNETDLPTFTLMGGEIDTDKWTPCLRDIQVTELKPILGKALYNKIMADYDNDALDGKYEELYAEYIFDYLIHSTSALYMHIGTVMVTNGGISVAIPDGNQAITPEKEAQLSNFQRSRAKHFERGMKKFLKDNATDIPEYVLPHNDDPTTDILGWYIPDEY